MPFVRTERLSSTNNNLSHIRSDLVVTDVQQRDQLQSLLARDRLYAGIYNHDDGTTKITNHDDLLVRKNNNYATSIGTRSSLNYASSKVHLGSSSICDKWRKKMCLWAFRLVDHWVYDRNIVAIAMSLLDRYIFIRYYPNEDKVQRRRWGDGTVTTTSYYYSSKKCRRIMNSSSNNTNTNNTNTTKISYSSNIVGRMNQSEYQLAAMTCVYIAMKLNPELQQQQNNNTSGHYGNESHSSQSKYYAYDFYTQQFPVPFQLSSFVSLSRGRYQCQDILGMELHILNVLEWKVHPVIPSDIGISLLHSIWYHTNISTCVYKAMEELVQYIFELILIHMGSSCCTYEWRPYQIAAGTILFVMDILSTNAVSMQIRTFCQVLLLRSTVEREQNEVFIGHHRTDKTIMLDDSENSKQSPKSASMETTVESNEHDNQHRRTIMELQVLLQQAVLPEVLTLLEDELRNANNNYPNPPNNPIAHGHALGIFDMDKVYRYFIFYKQQQPATNDTGVRRSDNNSILSLSSSSITSDSEESKQSSSTFSSTTTTKLHLQPGQQEDISGQSTVTTTTKQQQQPSYSNMYFDDSVSPISISENCLRYK